MTGPRKQAGNGESMGQAIVLYVAFTRQICKSLILKDLARVEFTRGWVGFTQYNTILSCHTMSVKVLPYTPLYFGVPWHDFCGH